MNVRPLPLALRSLAVAALVLVTSPLASAKTEPEAAAKKPAADAPPIRFAHTYAQAMAEAKDRGCIVFATMHMDGCSWCEKQDKEVFAKPEFKTWAADNVVFLLAYKGHEHAHGEAAGEGEAVKVGDGAAEKPESKANPMPAAAPPAK